MLSTSVGDVEQWDSMGHIRLITELEREFETRLEFSDIVELSTVGRVQEFLEKNIGL